MTRRAALAAVVALAVLAVPPADARPQVDPTAPAPVQAHERVVVDQKQRDLSVRKWEDRAVKDRIRKGQESCQINTHEAQAICASTHRLQEETQR